MFRISFFALLTILLLTQLGCSSEKPTDNFKTFVVTIENISTFYTSSGIFDTPGGDLSSGPADPGDSYEFSFTAAAGSHLSLATMFVESNDLFFSPGVNGIDLFPGGTAISGNITSEFSLWDAGTEVNEQPGVGPNQPLRQDDTDTGTTEDKAIDLEHDSFIYPTVSNVITVSITRDVATSPATFTVKVDNVSDDGIFQTAIGPGVWVVHTGSNPIFTPGVKDQGNGLEDLAEDGDSTKLGIYFASTHGDPIFLGPGLWIAHSGPFQLFENGTVDLGFGLEALAEDGDPTGISTAVTTMEGVMNHGIFNLPEGATAPGIAFPGQSYKFTFEAEPGYKLTFATMFVQSNDLFYAPATDLGFDLFPDGSPFTGDITSLIDLWDCGTEVNEEPGVGVNQAPRQDAPNTGVTESGVVQPLSNVDDGYTYPQLSKSIRVTISAN